ncbi:Crp/Fnr family transcriptional regulator [Skermanella mucosa]|uniref:Crp/Fnr family transcriptional regulator n=1 Tax=Skermanella mucosa TaxID=1789672 RepID=UPI00192B5E78|nr:Crp/Fnr family transcriptional regulator [Skermanella mucosa]UEM18517.1 Crp/Fnr family transcriptional regulator [Skermanella mucosa]
MPAQLADLSPRDSALLRNLPLFQQLAEPVLASLLATATVRTVERGTDLFVQGDPADRFYIVLEGWVKLYRINRDGAEAVVTMVNAGESFAEAAMFAQGNFPVCAQAVTDVRALSITSQAFARCVQADVRTAFAMLGSLSMRLRTLVQQIEQLQVQSAPQRVGGFLLKLCPAGAGNASFMLPLEKSLVARRLGIQPETFSRALAKLRPIGVEVQGAVVSVSDIDALREFCQEDPAEA